MKGRINSYDIARTLAIICIVLCHCVEFIYEVDTDLYNVLSIQSNVFKTILFTIGRLGVPIFLFLSGALLLKKQVETDEDIIKFYKKNLLPLYFTTAIWTIIYNIFIAIKENVMFNIEDTIFELLFLKKVPLDNMWYMPMIIVIYVAIPFIANIVKTFSIKTIIPAITITAIYTSILPTINEILKRYGISTYNHILDLNFLGGIYGGYIIIGYIISKGYLKKLKLHQCSLIFLLFFVITVVMQVLLDGTGSKYYVWYNNIFLIISAIFLFEILTRIKNTNQKLNNIVENMSKSSLAYFFIHIIIIETIGGRISVLPIILPLKTIILFIATFSLTGTSVWILKRLKIIREKILYIK